VITSDVAFLKHLNNIFLAFNAGEHTYGLLSSAFCPDNRKKHRPTHSHYSRIAVSPMHDRPTPILTMKTERDGKAGKNSKFQHYGNKQQIFLMTMSQIRLTIATHFPTNCSSLSRISPRGDVAGTKGCPTTAVGPYNRLYGLDVDHTSITAPCLSTVSQLLELLFVIRIFF